MPRVYRVRQRRKKMGKEEQCLCRESGIDKKETSYRIKAIPSDTEAWKHIIYPEADLRRNIFGSNGTICRIRSCMQKFTRSLYISRKIKTL